MRRAAATASHGLRDTGVPIIAWPLLTGLFIFLKLLTLPEFYPDGPENKALNFSENQAFYDSLPSPLSLDALEEEWWSPVRIE